MTIKFSQLLAIIPRLTDYQLSKLHSLVEWHVRIRARKAMPPKT